MFLYHFACFLLYISHISVWLFQDIETRVFSPTTYTFGEERPRLGQDEANDESGGSGGSKTGNRSGGGTGNKQKRKASESSSTGGSPPSSAAAASAAKRHTRGSQC